MRIPAALLVVALACVAQTKSGKKEPQDKPSAIQGFVLPGTVLAKDIGCAKDYAKALTAEGVQQRKMIADLFEYGCAEQLRFVYVMWSSEKPQAVPSSEKRTVTFWKVSGLLNHTMSDKLLGKVDSAASEFGKEGWVVNNDFLQLSEDAMMAKIEKAKKIQ